MKRSIDRILVSHAGSLPRPDDLREMLIARDGGQPYDEQEFTRRVRGAVTEVVRKQVESGIDIVDDGELSKINFTAYARQRLSGVEERKPDAGRPPFKIYGRDEAEFPEYFAARSTFSIREAACTGPIKYIGQSAVQANRSARYDPGRVLPAAR